MVSTPKHFAVHSGPEPPRHQVNVDVSPHDLEDTYLPAFRAAITEAHAQSVMCAYNAIDGAPACANTMLLRDHLRDAWHFDGYVVSDCGAVADVDTGHHYAPDMAARRGGCGEGRHRPGVRLRQDRPFRARSMRCTRTWSPRRSWTPPCTACFRARFRLGMFDPPASYAYGRIPFSENNSPEHRQLALQAARESMVLLKNEDGPAAEGRA